MPRCRTCKSSHIECQVRLIKESVFGREGGNGAVGHVAHLAQRRLKPDDFCVALRAIANPDAHHAVQVPQAHVATTGQIRHPQASVIMLDFTKRHAYSAVKACVLEAPQQKPLEHVDAPFRCVRAKLLCDEVMKACGPAQPNTPPH